MEDNTTHQQGLIKALSQSLASENSTNFSLDPGIQLAAAGSCKKIDLTTENTAIGFTRSDLKAVQAASGQRLYGLAKEKALQSDVKVKVADEEADDKDDENVEDIDDLSEFGDFSDGYWFDDGSGFYVFYSEDDFYAELAYLLELYGYDTSLLSDDELYDLAADEFGEDYLDSLFFDVGYIDAGPTGGQTFSASFDFENLFGTPFDDLFISNGFTDLYMFGFEGDDAFFITNNFFGGTGDWVLDGGDGFNTLFLEGGGNITITDAALDLSRIADIAAIDLSFDTTANTLTIDAEAILEMTTEEPVNTFYVYGGANDDIAVTGANWSAAGSSGAYNFFDYNFGGEFITMVVDAGVTVAGGGI